MTRFLLIIISALFMCVSMLADSKSFSERENTEIVIKQKALDDKSHGHRVPAKIPIEAYYDSFVRGIAITFTRDLGDIEVNVTNHSTGEYLEGTMNATAGVTILPISGAEGFYTITFTLPGGTEYYGEFEL